ncbi:MAG: glycosyltransferase, partial [Candidatus Dormibacteraeota bacterium]|nr:glycosyltransferase [Candidatus Dormibacteraeota bacterium]
LVAPYRVDREANHTSDALKLYDYFATGLPVLATRVAGFERYPELVEFWPPASSLRDAIARQSSGAAKRRAIAREADWSKRAATMRAVLESAAGCTQPSQTASIVVTFNSERHVGRCLQALAANAATERCIVWDNDSRDRSVEVALKRAPRVDVVRSDRNLGFSAAVNRAAERVPGCDLLLVNPDAELLQGALAALKSALRSEPRIGVAACRLINSDGVQQPDSWAFPTPVRATLGAALGLSRAYAVRKQRTASADILRNAFVPFTAALVRRAAFDALRGLDEGFWMYGEDSDFCFRAQQAGWRIAVAPQAVARHVGGASSDAVMRSEAVVRGGERFRAKHFSAAEAAVAGGALRLGADARLLWERAAGRFATEPRSRAEWRAVRDHYRR